MTKKVLELANLPAREPTVSQETLDATPARAVTFLRALGTAPVLRKGLEGRGYSPDEHRRGWALLQASSGYDADAEAGGSATRVDPAVRDAIVEIDAWEEDGFRIVRAALGRLHPEQAKTVLAGLSPSTGAAAILGVETLLDRLDTLATSKNADDRAAIATLAVRALDEAERKRLRALVKVAKEGTSRDDTPAEEKVAPRQAVSSDPNRPEARSPREARGSSGRLAHARASASFAMRNKSKAEASMCAATFPGQEHARSASISAGVGSEASRKCKTGRVLRRRAAGVYIAPALRNWMSV